ncbi:hypothetical protein IAQ61_005012 [Plenodomus lingam]|uniref:Alpha-carbonic anhydrase domain-containing protein n=1 Tax=Leptosphaeria maculans (strain JN3 / isolate v23.1.3 / race Av1-4-5-6-7-8) TaxID=985895 RepID=M1ZJS5_LEPMJ|nr:hypothetical protein IAQ61_005012 [Plenodomus lingam]CCT61169.1 predicted protein [Plenodomus lingam JN3]
MFFKSFALAAILAPVALACPDHSNNKPMPLGKRTTLAEVEGKKEKSDWTYEASYDWGKVNKDYRMCQIGTHQSPIPLAMGNGLAQSHVPRFDYNGSVKGTFFNTGYGPGFTVHHEDNDWTRHPSITYDNETVYLKGLHVHTPADHTVGGHRSKAEIHFVHVDAEGNEAAVLAIRIDPGQANNQFFQQLPPMIELDKVGEEESCELNLTLALDAVLHFNEFWTYEGSLTSPPCTEGIRWFVARQIMFTSVKEMQDILGASSYSARSEQAVWQHRINV